jgi:hypothetical protein
MSKKERIEYLESEVTELHAKVAELIERVGELEKKLSGYWLLDKNSPNVVTFPINNAYCQWCQKSYDSSRWHLCPNYPNQWVDPNKQWFTLSFSNKTEVSK